jgi:hypothetical protein
VYAPKDRAEEQQHHGLWCRHAHDLLIH